MRRNNNYLVHAKGKGKGSRYGKFIMVNGRPNNSPEYNHNYYFFNKEKWQNIYNKAKTAVKGLNQNDITKGTAKGSGGMPTNVRNKYTNTEIAKGKVKDTFNAAGRRVNSAREQARLTFNNAGAAVERARQAAKGYGAKIRYKVGSAAKEAGRRMGNAAYQLNPNSNRITKGTAKGSGGMPSNVRKKYTNTEIAKSKAKSVGRRAGQLYDEAGRRLNAAKDAAVNTYNDVRREAGRRLHNAAYQLNPNANDVTRGRTAAGMPSNVRSRYTNTENLKRGAKDTINRAGKQFNSARDAAGRILKEAGRQAGNAAYRLNPNGNDVTRGRTAAGMPSDVRARYTNTEKLKRGAKNAVNNAGKRVNDALDTVTGKANDWKAKASSKLNKAGQAALEKVVNEVTRQISNGIPTNEIPEYATARKQLKDIGLSNKQISTLLGLNTFDSNAENMKTKQKAFIDDVADGLRRTGMSVNDLLKSQSFDLTLAEFGGYDPDKLSEAEKKRLRKELINKLG